jgi:hypothetical protein
MPFWRDGREGIREKKDEEGKMEMVRNVSRAARARRFSEDAAPEVRRRSAVRSVSEGQSGIKLEWDGN